MDLDANVFSEKVQIDLQKQIPMNKCVWWEKFQIVQDRTTIEKC